MHAPLTPVKMVEHAKELVLAMSVCALQGTRDLHVLQVRLLLSYGIFELCPLNKYIDTKYLASLCFLWHFVQFKGMAQAK